MHNILNTPVGNTIKQKKEKNKNNKYWKNRKKTPKIKPEKTAPRPFVFSAFTCVDFFCFVLVYVADISFHINVYLALSSCGISQYKNCNS